MFTIFNLLTFNLKRLQKGIQAETINVDHTGKARTLGHRTYWKDHPWQLVKLRHSTVPKLQNE